MWQSPLLRVNCIAPFSVSFGPALTGAQQRCVQDVLDWSGGGLIGHRHPTNLAVLMLDFTPLLRPSLP
jgi:hypothetical protein